MVVPNISLKGKVSIVTGGRQGIGRAIALTLAGAGADVVVSDQTVADGQLEKVAGDIRRLGQRSLAVQADVSRKADVDNLVQKVMAEFGAVDILVNNAGIIVRTPLMDTPEEDWDKVIDIDLKGCYLCAQAVGRKMMAQKKGVMVNLASTLGLKVQKNTGAYCIAKAGVIMLTRVLAVELGSYNIRVNAIAPGIVRTDFSKSIWADPEGVFLQTIFWPFYAASTLSGSAALDVHCESDGFPAPPSLGSSLPYLDVSATLDEGQSKLFISVVNRHKDEAVEAGVEVGPAALGSEGRAHVITGEAPSVTNSFHEPANVALHSEPFEVPSGQFRYTFPACSISILELGLR